MATASAAKDVATDDERMDEDSAFIDIVELQKLGIGMADITKLRQSHICTIGQLLRTTSKVLLNIKGISEAKLEKVVEAARKLLPTGFMSGVDALSQLQNRLHITTGAKELDTLLGGGVETKIITELFGEYRTGKSELCAMLAVTAQLGVEHGGGAGKVIILSTDASFRVDRIADIAEKRFGLNRTEVLENIAVATILNHEHQLELTKMVYAKIVDDEMPTRLIIVDSVIDHFRTEFSGRGELAERQQKLGPHLRELRKIAEEFNVAVVVTNQITADPGNMFVADAKKPTGGNIMGHNVDVRVYLRKGKGNQRIAKIHAGHLPENEAIFSISETGIVDGE